MMRTIEVLIVIIIITGAFVAVSFFAVLPSPREVSPMNLRRLSFTTLQMLDSNHDLSRAAFETDNPALWGGLQVALAASLPPNVIYNLTVYEVTGETTQLYTVIDSMSNAENLGATSDASTYMVASSNVTFNVIPEKIGDQGGGGGTLYILNCSDANGWWITGYTAQSLAQDLYNLLSPYFAETVMVQNTTQLGQLLDGDKISNSPYETVDGAVIINTYGEAVPIPASYANSGYYAPRSSYNLYFHILGQKTRLYNWTWASIVGYPMYYVSNVNLFSDNQNSWGVYGMRSVGDAGFNAFLRGLNQIDYDAEWFDGSQWEDAWWYNGWSWIYDHGWITTELPSVPLSSDAIFYSNYYGVYPSAYHTATRALPTWITTTYDLTVTASLFDPVNKNGEDYLAGAIYRNDVSGGFLALGLTRTPDIRLTALGLLSDFKPRLYNSEYAAKDTSRLVVLQLGLVGGV